MNWISVEERLPEMKPQFTNGAKCSERVLIFNGYFINVGKYEESYTRRIPRWVDATGRCSNVTHWMPLPEAPEVQG